MPSTSAIEVRSFFDARTGTATHLAVDPGTGRCAIVDPVLDFDAASGRTSTAAIDPVLACIDAERLSVDWILETHVHADHLSAAPFLQERVGGSIGIGARVVDAQAVFGQVFGAEPSFVADGRQFDRLFADGDTFEIGTRNCRVLHTPGHTPACVSYLVDDALFVGDTLFAPDFGTARCDFPGGDARTLYRSIQRLLELPDAVRVFLCHDYPPATRGPVLETTIGAQRAGNVHLGIGMDEDAFVAMREARDATLAVPALLLPSVQVNMRAGRLPPADANGVHYLRIPVDTFGADPTLEETSS